MSYKAKNFHIDPKTANQADYIDSLREHSVVFGVGCAGTGKTFLALSVAIERLINKDIDQIIVTRPPVADKDMELGFHKGTKEEKTMEWMGPIIDTVSKAVGPKTMGEWIQGQQLRLVDLETMRGQTFDNAAVILDEAQNCPLSILKMFLTRIGEHSTVTINGDTAQTDLIDRSGLSDVVHMVRNNPYRHVPVIEFYPDDVVRSQICKDFILMFRDLEAEQRSFH